MILLFRILNSDASWSFRDDRDHNINVIQPGFGVVFPEIDMLTLHILFELIQFGIAGASNEQKKINKLV